MQPFEGPAQWFIANTEEIELNINVELAHISFTADEKGYKEGVEAIRSKIAAGDVYQVNLTMRAEINNVTVAELFAIL